MKYPIRSALAVVFLFLLSSASFGQTLQQQQRLHRLSDEYRLRLQGLRGPVYQQLKALSTGPAGRLNLLPDIELMYVDESGMPRYFHTHNLNAARTISTDNVWPGGDAGYDLTGDGTSSSELAVWDGGGVRTTHQEFENRATQIDNPGSYSDHSTHVAGTMIAAGISNDAKGGSYEAELSCYEWNNDADEMADAAAAGLQVSNHSYGLVTGWYFDGDDWYWYGDPSVSQTEDYGFGYYGSEARIYDQIVCEAPNYVICKSAGNDRNDTGPGDGGEHYVWDNGGWTLSTTTRDPDGGDDGYDCIGWTGNAKNIITVGAVGDLTNGYQNADGVVMADFSGWGPTDDGRIKPDICANGIQLTSSSSSGDADYVAKSGTSMSTPNLSGSVNLLIGMYEELHNDTEPLASTMKAILIHTADECGPDDGPDYMFGWGLMNTEKAADLIAQDETIAYTIQESFIVNGGDGEFTYYSQGNEPITVTLVWTDPEGSVPFPPSLDPDNVILVNDLDLSIEGIEADSIFLPYVLDPENPEDAATVGDNDIDNVEKIVIENPVAGEYRVRINHEGAISDGPQFFSLVITGLSDDAPDLEAPTNISCFMDNVTGAVTVGWTAVSGQSGTLEEYRVYRNLTLIGSTTETTYDDQLLDYGNNSYTVTAYYTEGESPALGPAPANWSSPGTNYFTPLAPSGIAYEITIDSVRIDGEFLSAGDEIGIYDGGTCVGAVVAPMEQNWPRRVAAWQNNPDVGRPGFTVGNNIIYRVYRQSGNYLSYGDPTYSAGDGTFGSGEEAEVALEIISTPAEFTLLSPSGHLVQHDTQVVLTWDASVDPDPLDEIWYSVFVSNQADDLGDPVTTGLSGATYTYDSAEDETLFWTVEAIDSHDNIRMATDTLSFLLTVTDGLVPFALLSPDSGLASGDTLPTLVWGQTASAFQNDPVSYVLYYGIGDPTFTDPDSVAGLTDTSYTFTGEGFESGDVVYWRVRAYSEQAGSLWATPEAGWFFAVSYSTPPAAFNLIAPSDSAVSGSLDMMFVWAPSIDPDPDDVVEYTLELAEDSEFTSPVREEAGSQPFYSVNYLDDDMQYWWRVIAEDQTGNEVLSTQSWSFFTSMEEEPGEFILYQPAPNSIIHLTDPWEINLVWQRSVDPDPGDEVTYNLFLLVSRDDAADTLITYAGLEDTSIVVNLPDSLNYLPDWVYDLDVMWWVGAVSEQHFVQCVSPFEFTLIPPLDVEDKPFSGVPEKFEIAAVYPNPFNPVLSVVVGLPETSNVTVTIFDALGRRVDVLRPGSLAAGFHRLNWEARGPSGMYFLRIEDGHGHQDLRKVHFIK